MPTKKTMRQTRSAATMTPKDLAPQRTNPRNDPPMIVPTIRIMKVLEISLSNDLTDITPAKLFTVLQGTTNLFKKVRVDKIEAWADAVSPGRVQMTIPGDSAWDSTDFIVVDNGVSGAQRARVGVRPALLQRARWLGPADTTVLATVSGVGGAGGVTHITCEFST